MNIRNRLTLQFAGIFALILILFSLTVYYFTSLYRQNDFFNRARERAYVTANFVLDMEEVPEKTKQLFTRRFYQVLPFEIVRIYDSQNKLVFAEGNGKMNVTQAILTRIRANQKIELFQGERQIVGITYADNQGEFIVIASCIDQYSIGKLSHLKNILIIGFFCAMLIVLVAGWFFSKEALRPISRIIREVETINGTDMHQRLSQPDGKDELWQLAYTFNKMLDRLETSFEMQSTFVSSASHELRTPLTAMIGQIEVALMKNREPEDYRQVLESILDDARMLGRLSNGLLQIAQASSDESKIKLKLLRFDELIWAAQEEIRKRNPEIPVDITFETYPDDEEKLLLNGNESLLLIALLNVFENSIKFSKKGQTVKASIYITRNNFTVRVIDQGIGIKEEDLVNVFVPFFRAENVRDISGHGIGLPLTEKIIKLHKGSIQVLSHLNQGTEVIIKIPSGR